MAFFMFYCKIQLFNYFIVIFSHENKVIQLNIKKHYESNMCSINLYRNMT